MASASAICGTRRGFTKLATSMRRMPGVDGAADEFEFHLGGDRGRLVLQAVARPDLDDADAARIRHCDGLYTQRAAAISRRGPA